jgi:DNA-binding beta-propeller fold protein YncE
MLTNEMLGGVRKRIVEGDMKARRFVSGALFVLGVYFFGMYLTAADGGPALTDHLLYVLFGSNRNAGIDCSPGSPPLPCNPGVLKAPNGAVEIVDLGTDPPSLRKAIDLGASNPTSIAVAPDGKRFYFVDNLNSNVYVVDPVTGAFLGTTPIPEGPIDCVLSVDGKYLYVTTQEPSVVTVETRFGTVVGKVAPGQSYREEFGGIALRHGDTADQLAVAATSSAPAYYLFGASKGALSLGQRVEVSGGCTNPSCGRGDDVAYGDSDRLLLATLACNQMFTYAPSSGTQISRGSFGTEACLPLNPQNSLLYSQLTQLAYIVTRHYSLGLAPGLAVVDPATYAGSFFISGLGRIPEAAAFAPGGRYLYIVGQDTFISPLVLDRYDALNGDLTRGAYAFSLLAQNRTAIDAKIVQAPGVFATLAGGLPFVGAKSALASLGQIGLLVFGVALLAFDGRRRRARG